MGADTKIPWAHHSFNPWHGCTKVDVHETGGCVNCYAKTISDQRGQNLWGPGKERKGFPERHWRSLLNWDQDAKKAGENHRIMIGSMCDVFDPEASNHWRRKLWDYCDVTYNLTKMLITKRPENAFEMLPKRWLKKWPKGVWFIVSVSDQITADNRLPLATHIPALVRGVSYEPAVGPVDFYPFLMHFDWLIVGGESLGSRPFNLQWARDARDACKVAGVAFYMKQMGYYLSHEMGLDHDPKGEHLHNIPEDLRIREFPNEEE